MARYDFGGTLADFVVTSHRLGTLDTLALSAATLTMWSAQSGGTRYSDLVLNGSAVSSIAVGTDGQVPKFQGPDGVTEVWADGGAGRVRIATLQGTPGPAGANGAPGPQGPPGSASASGDTDTANFLNNAASATRGALAKVALGFTQAARNPDLIITGTVTRDANGAATSAPVTWPDGTPGTYTATTVSSAFPGAVDAYQITYGSPVTKTYTQPTITRDPATGAATNVPAIVAS